MDAIGHLRVGYIARRLRPADSSDQRWWWLRYVLESPLGKRYTSLAAGRPFNVFSLCTGQWSEGCVFEVFVIFIDFAFGTSIFRCFVLHMNSLISQEKVEHCMLQQHA